MGMQEDKLIIPAHDLGMEAGNDWRRNLNIIGTMTANAYEWLIQNKYGLPTIRIDFNR